MWCLTLVLVIGLSPPLGTMFPGSQCYSFQRFPMASWVALGRSSTGQQGRWKRDSGRSCCAGLDDAAGESSIHALRGRRSRTYAVR